MKKLLVLLLVCSMATVASAALEWTVSGGSAAGGDAQPGDTLTFQLLATEGTSSGFQIGYIADFMGDAAYEGGNFVSVEYNDNYNVIGGEGLTTAAFDAFLGSAGMGASGIAMGNLVWMSAAASGETQPSGALLTFIYEVDAAAALGTVVVDAFADPTGLLGIPNATVDLLVGGVSTTEAIEAFSFNVVPEPMTMALLGLGGLFLRRRK